MRPSPGAVAASGDGVGLSGAGAIALDMALAGGTALDIALAGAMTLDTTLVGAIALDIEGARTGAGSCRRAKAALIDDGMSIACTGEMASSAAKNCDVCISNDRRVL